MVLKLTKKTPFWVKMQEIPIFNHVHDKSGQMLRLFASHFLKNQSKIRIFRIKISILSVIFAKKSIQKFKIFKHIFF